jgi:hypothetical protein
MRRAGLLPLITFALLLNGCTDKPCDFAQVAKDEVVKRDAHASLDSMTVRSIKQVKDLMIVSLRTDDAQHSGAIVGIAPKSCQVDALEWDFEG